MAEEIDNRIDARLALHTSASKGRTVTFTHEILEDEAGAQTLYIKCKMGGSNLVADQTISMPDEETLMESVDMVALSLRWMTEVADEELAIGGLGPLLVVEEE